MRSINAIPSFVSRNFLMDLITKEQCYMEIIPKKDVTMSLRAKMFVCFPLHDKTRFTMPPMSEYLVGEEVIAKIKQAMRRQEHTLVVTLHEKSTSKLEITTVDEFLSCFREGPLEWDLVFRRVSGQSFFLHQE